MIQKSKHLLLFITLAVLIPCFNLNASILSPLKLDHARDTMTSYLSIMAKYNAAITNKDENAAQLLMEASRCFDLSQVNPVIRDKYSMKAVQQIKEVIDRVIIIKPELIPDSQDVKRWRLKDTEITISYIKEGDHTGEYLFTSETVLRAQEFYNKVKHLPYLKGSGNGAHLTTAFWEKNLPAWTQGETVNVPNWQWLGLLISILFGFFIKFLVENLIHLFKKLTERKDASLRHKSILAIEKPSGLIAATFFWLGTVHLLEIEGTLLATLLVLIKVTFSISFIWAAYNFTDIIASYLDRLTQKTENTLDDQLVPLVTKALRVFIVIFGLLMTIQNLGFNVMSLMAGLGLGGLAFALAAKDTAANLFGSIMIIIDRPFRVGDWIVANGVEGTVEEVGFRSTRIRTFYSSLVTVPNSILATTKIDNMGERQYRRDLVTLGVTYETSPKSLQSFIEGIKEIIKSNPHTRKDYFHVVFKSYADFSLNIMLYYFIKTDDWSLELKERENIYFEIYALADKLGVNFAYPTQTIYHEKKELLNE
ncbi:MAG: mechanosensitive ion channel family protein [Bdellovibrionaceae bacterium]|jgi:MscS family membrane protein|nr:mechanosensitive ion channel family protein [Pseudobdellovibrionaceae bacterium]